MAEQTNGPTDPCDERYFLVDLRFTVPISLKPGEFEEKFEGDPLALRDYLAECLVDHLLSDSDAVPTPEGFARKVIGFRPDEEEPDLDEHPERLPLWDVRDINGEIALCAVDRDRAECMSDQFAGGHHRSQTLRGFLSLGKDDALHFTEEIPS